jgi:hypothetical protein
MIFEEPRAWTFLAETLIAPLARQAPTFTLLRSARRRIYNELQRALPFVGGAATSVWVRAW